MPRNPEDGGEDFSQWKAPEDSEGKKLSPEELKFEELVADAAKRPLRGTRDIRNSERKQAEHEHSLKGSYEESGDPKKMAVYALQEASGTLRVLVVALNTGNLDKNMKERMQKVESLLTDLGLTIPTTSEEAKSLSREIMNFDNYQKLVSKFKEEK